MRRCFFAIVSCLLTMNLVSGQTISLQVHQFVKVDAPVGALTHVRVIDGTGASARDDQTVILAKGQIVSVADAGPASVSKNAQVLDLHGYSVIPGLVGMHDHLGYRMAAAAYGETAVSS